MWLFWEKLFLKGTGGLRIVENHLGFSKPCERIHGVELCEGSMKNLIPISPTFKALQAGLPQPES